jgi:hypothetical protein
MIPKVQYLHAIEGRLRVKVPEIKGAPERARSLVAHFDDLAGIRAVQANPVTGNVLFLVEPDGPRPDHILAALDALGYMQEAASPSPRAAQASVATCAGSAELSDKVGQVLLQLTVRVIQFLINPTGIVQDLVGMIAEFLLRNFAGRTIAALT